MSAVSPLSLATGAPPGARSGSGGTAIVPIEPDAETAGAGDVPESASTADVVAACSGDESRVMGLALMLLAVTAAPALLNAYAENVVVSRWRDDYGVDVRQTYDVSYARSNSARRLSTDYGITGTFAILLGACVSARIWLRNTVGADSVDWRAVRRGEAAVLLPLAVWGVGYLDSAPNNGIDAGFVIGCGIFFVLHARFAVRPHLGATAAWLWLAQWLWTSIVGALNSFTVLGWYVSTDTSETQRFWWRLLGRPLGVELCLAPMRAIARLFHGERMHYSMLSYWMLLASFTLGGRLEILTMRTTQGTAAVIAGVAVVETALRLTVLQRDGFYASLWMRDRQRGRAFTRTFRAREMAAQSLAMEHVAEDWATMLLAVIFATYRLGEDREAPAGRSIVGAAAVQLVVEVVVDLLPVAFLLLSRRTWLERRLRSRLRLRHNAIASWDPWFKAVAALLTVGPVLRFATFLQYSPEEDWGVIFCPWSWQPSSFWGVDQFHRVPCSDAKDWLS